MTKKAISSLIGNLVICTVVIIVFAVSFVPSALTVSGDDNPISKGTSKTEVSLMVNVYWGTEYLPDMLEVFARHNVKTTFFVGGMWAAENDAMLKRICGDGHELANHGYYHKDHKKLDYNRNREEIEITHKVVEKTVGVDMNLFAPPSGSYNSVTLKAAEDLGYRTIMWTLDTIDWRDQDEELIFKRATEKISGGALVLMHPTKATAAALDRIISAIEGKGLTVAPVSKVIGTSQINL